MDKVILRFFYFLVMFLLFLAFLFIYPLRIVLFMHIYLKYFSLITTLYFLLANIFHNLQKNTCIYIFFSIDMFLLKLIKFLPQIVGVSPSGKASAFGADIRWFESSHPSHILQSRCFSGFFFYLQAFNLVRKFILLST